MVRARFVTRISGTVSAAPQATFLAVEVSCADLSFGTMTASTPAASAVRKQAPRLCGSVTPSKMSKNGADLLAKIASKSCSLSSFCGTTRAIMP